MFYPLQVAVVWGGGGGGGGGKQGKLPSKLTARLTWALANSSDAAITRISSK